MPAPRLPKLPQLLDRKIYKTGQTRGADDDEIYQNRVSRSSTVLIPYGCWELCDEMRDGGEHYENGFIVLISPTDYSSNPNIADELTAKGLMLGVNAVVFYETREQWEANNPEELGWEAAISRVNPLGGFYVARIPATTATENGGKIIRGFDQTAKKGAGIRVYEYASSVTISNCRFQLEALFWLCADSDRVAVANGMQARDVELRRTAILAKCAELELLDYARLTHSRILNARNRTICPLCLEELSGQGFFNRMEQAEGREVSDLTITQLNLFHINELRYGVLNHRPYNLGWGHHHCNVVVKDSGIIQTLEWMRQTLNRNIQEGYLPVTNRAS
jgi:BstXI restriction endonuclease